MVIGGVSPLGIVPIILRQHHKIENRESESIVLNMMAKTVLQHLSGHTKIPLRMSSLSESAWLHVHFEIVTTEYRITDVEWESVAHI